MFSRVFYEASRDLDSRPPSRNQPRRSLSSPRVYVWGESSSGPREYPASRPATAGPRQKQTRPRTCSRTRSLEPLSPSALGWRGLTPRGLALFKSGSASGSQPRRGLRHGQGRRARPPRSLREKALLRAGRTAPVSAGRSPGKAAGALREPLPSLRKWSGWTTRTWPYRRSPGCPRCRYRWERLRGPRRSLRYSGRCRRCRRSRRRGPSARRTPSGRRAGSRPRASASASAARPPRSWRRWPSSSRPSRA